MSASLETRARNAGVMLRGGGNLDGEEEHNLNQTFMTLGSSR